MARGGRAVTAPRRFSEFVDDIAHLKLSVFAQSDENKTIYSSFSLEKTCSVTCRCAFENIFQDGGHVTLPLFTPEIYVNAHTSQGAAFCLLERCLNFLFVYISFTQCITSLNNPVVMTCPYTLLGLLICYCWAFGDPAWVPCGVVYKLAHACRWPLFER